MLVGCWVPVGRWSGAGRAGLKQHVCLVNIVLGQGWDEKETGRTGCNEVQVYNADGVVWCWWAAGRAGLQQRVWKVKGLLV